MKKAVSLILTLLMCLSLCACGASLSTEQKGAKQEADEEFELMCENIPGTTFSSSVKKIDGHYVYSVQLNTKTDLNDSTAEAFKNLLFRAILDILCAADIHPVLYLNDQYQIVDNHLDSINLD